MKITDVTDRVEYGNPDDEYLPIHECVCGHKFDYWDLSISVYADDPKECPHCGVRMFFSVSVKVFRVDEV